jgi:hypothetical protein
MNEFFASVKADLTDRRLLPVVAGVCVILVAALAYALLGGHGSSSSSSGTPVPAPTSQLPTGIAVTGAQAREAVSETTDGFKDQQHGVAKNPFAPLPGAETAPTAATVASTPAGGSGGESTATTTSTAGGEESSGSSEPSGSEETTAPTKPKKKAKTVYDVTVQFGTLPPGTAPEDAQLHEYKKLRLQTPLPSSEQPLMVFRGVTAKGRSATFTLVGEAILTGAGTCLPSPQQCQAVDLKPGETEQLNALGPNGESTIYELRVLNIKAETAKASKNGKASAASRHPKTVEWGVSRVGQQLLRKAGLVALPFLRYSSQPGVLVFAKPKPKKPHA